MPSIANYVVHEHTLGLTPACYLGDLFVDPAQRAAGVVGPDVGSEAVLRVVGDGERLVGLRRERPQAHRGRDEAPDDGGGRLHLIERHGRAPMLDLSLFRIASFAGANTVALLVSLGMFGVFFFVSL